MSGRPVPYKALLDAAKHSMGFLRHVPGKEHVTVVARPQWIGGEHWAITRHGDNPDEGNVWDGDDWAASNLPVDQIYRWTLPQVVQELSRAVADLSVIPSAWRAQHETPEDLDEEYLAEFGTAEVA